MRRRIPYTDVVIPGGHFSHNSPGLRISDVSQSKKKLTDAHV
jgi:hypothetical protein